MAPTRQLAVLAIPLHVVEANIWMDVVPATQEHVKLARDVR